MRALLGLRLGLFVFLVCIGYSLVLSQQVQFGDPGDKVGWQVILQYSLAFICMAAIWQSMQQAEQSIETLQWVIGVAVVARLLLLFTDPYTSNDVDRYLFDGRIAYEGLDPYRTPHSAPELSHLTEQWSPPAEHAKYVTLYPPIALALFSFAAAFGVGYALLIWKLLTTAASIIIVFVGYAVLKKADKLRHFALLALSPLLILEAGEGAHLDVFSALAVVCAVYYWQRQRYVIAGLMVGLGVLIKLLPVLMALPMLLLILGWRPKAVFGLSAFFTWILGYVAAFALGLQPIGSIAVFFEKWRSGSPVFLWLEPYVDGTTLLIILAFIFVMSLSGIALVAYLRRQQAVMDSYFLFQLSMAVPLILSPVIFPWYLMPLLVLCALRPSAIMLTWAFVLPMLYEVLNQFLCCQHWQPSSWPIHLIGASLLVAALYDLAGGRLLDLIKVNLYKQNARNAVQ